MSRCPEFKSQCQQPEPEALEVAPACARDKPSVDEAAAGAGLRAQMGSMRSGAAREEANGVFPAGGASWLDQPHLTPCLTV